MRPEMRPQYTITLNPESVAIATREQPVGHPVIFANNNNCCSAQSALRVPYPALPVLHLSLMRDRIEASNKKAGLFSFAIKGIPEREQWLHAHPEVKQELELAFNELRLGLDVSLGSFSHYLQENEEE